MKNIFRALTLLVAFTTVSCVNDDDLDNRQPSDVEGVVINEVYTFSDQSEADDLDWIELYNTTDADIDLTGALMWESGGSEEAWAFPQGSVIKAKGYFVVDSDKYELLGDPVNHPAWGLSKGPDEKIVLANSDYTVIDEVELPSLNTDETYGRKEDGSAEWQIFQKGTKGAKNQGPARAEVTNVSGLYINEVYTDNSEVYTAAGWDATVDFIEFYNSTDADFDLSGYKVYDDKHEEETSYTFPSGTVVPAKGFFTVDVFKENPAGPAFGLGAGGDWVFLHDPDGEKVDEIEIPSLSKESGNRDKGYTYGRKPDGSANLVWFTEATKGASNNDAAVLDGTETPDPDPVDPGTDVEPDPNQPTTVVFNELCGNKAYDGQKYIELYNTGDAEVNLVGWTIRKYAADATDVEGKYNNCWAPKVDIKIPAGGYLVLVSDSTDPTVGFDAGLSAKKGLKLELVDPFGNVIDFFLRGEDADPFGEESLAENKDASFSRVPNGTGDWAYAVPTPGAANGEKTGDIEGYESAQDQPATEPEPEIVYDYTKLVLNELSGAGEDNEKFWELYNAGDQEIDLKGVYINKDEELAWTGAEGQKIPAKGYFAIIGAKNTTADGFSSGFSAKKSVIVELYAPDGKKLDTFQRGEKGSAWGDQGLDDNKGSWSRIPDGTGAFMITPTATPDAANDGTGAVEDPDLVGNGATAPVEPEKAAKVVFNELCGNKIPDGPQKYIELYNAGEAEADLSGWTIYKNNVADAVWTAPAGVKLAAGAYLVLEADQPDPTLGFNAGLSAKKEVKFELKDASGNSVDKFVRGNDAVVDGEEAKLNENTEASFSRVPNGTGDWAYAAPTPGAANGEKTGDIENE